MKHFALILLVLAAGFSSTMAQTTAQIGTGTTVPANTLYAPIYRFSNSSSTDYSRANILYTAAELSAAGITNGSTISKIAFSKPPLIHRLAVHCSISG